MSKKYYVPCAWQMLGYVAVEASSLEEAGQKVEFSENLRQEARSHAEEVAFSFEVDYEMMKDEEEMEPT